jgi:hypothetical protein
MLMLTEIFQKNQNIVNISNAKLVQIRKKHEINILLKRIWAVAKAERQYFVLILAEANAEYRQIF